MPDTPRLCGPTVVLRGLQPSDVDGRRRLGRDAEIVRLFGGTPQFTGRRPMDAEEAERWHARRATDPNPYQWAIEHTGRFIGSARLHALRRAGRRARYAVGILDPDLLGRGLGTEVTRLVLRFAFEDLALHRVELRVLAFNARAIACYRKCGFVEEGRVRDAARVGGAWQDDIIMAILEHEYRACAPAW